MHDFVWLARAAKVGAQGRAGPGDGAGLRQQGHLQGGEVAQAHKARALLRGAGKGLIGQGGQQAREAVAAARDQRHVSAAGRRAGNGGQARGVVAREALMAGQGGFIHLHFMA